MHLDFAATKNQRKPKKVKTSCRGRKRPRKRVRIRLLVRSTSRLLSSTILITRKLPIAISGHRLNHKEHELYSLLCVPTYFFVISLNWLTTTKKVIMMKKTI